jgi:hypothetical protein
MAISFHLNYGHLSIGWLRGERQHASLAAM